MSKYVVNEKTCEECGKKFSPSSNRQKWCETCGREIKHEKHLRRCSKNYYEKYRHLKGYNQKGVNNNAYKTGVGIYHRKKLSSMEKIQCERCGSLNHLVVHHKDRDRYNNSLDNLELLCKSCHSIEHMLHDTLGRFIGSK